MDEYIESGKMGVEMAFRDVDPPRGDGIREKYEEG
jgi:hypothetical protein